MTVLYLQELFGAIGSLRESRLKSVGTAEVVYNIAEDAFAAYSKYHGRNLDGTYENLIYFSKFCVTSVFSSNPYHITPGAGLG